MKPGRPTLAGTLFEYNKVGYGDKVVRGITIRCGYCDKGVQCLPVNNFKDNDERKEISFITRRLEGMGWKVGSNPSQHRCPKCFSAIKASKARKENEMSEKVVPIAVAKTTMTREDRRIIFEKLNEVYVGEKVGYAAGWTDEKVSIDLGVPRAWVKLIRDENFGDEMANDEIRQLITEAAAQLAAVKAENGKMDAMLAEYRKLAAISDRMEKSLETIKKALGGLL